MNPTRLFPAPHPDLVRALAGLPEVLDRVAPLRARHRSALPGAVAALSEFLTADRESLPPDYMGRPAYLSAYLRYFLPWNLLRQGRLLQGLGPELGLAGGGRVMEVGAGPLTFPLALWLSRPDLRGREVRYIGLDRTAAPLKIGRALFTALAPDSPWSIGTGKAAGSQGRSGPADRADLVVLANVLNESPAGPAKALRSWRNLTTAGGRVLVIEPGTRDGGRLIAELRRLALEEGWIPLAPCTHDQTCPLPGRGRGAWCHFAFSADGCPPWLDDLSRRAGLPKQRASLAFLLLQKDDRPAPAPEPGGGVPVRITSDAIDLPGRGRGVYGCCRQGLVLFELKDAAVPSQGDLVPAVRIDPKRKDQKTGALLVSAPAASRTGGKPRPRNR